MTAVYLRSTRTDDGTLYELVTESGRVLAQTTRQDVALCCARGLLRLHPADGLAQTDDGDRVLLSRRVAPRGATGDR